MNKSNKEWEWKRDMPSPDKLKKKGKGARVRKFLSGFKGLKHRGKTRLRKMFPRFSVFLFLSVWECYFNPQVCLMSRSCKISGDISRSCFSVADFVPSLAFAYVPLEVVFRAVGAVCKQTWLTDQYTEPLCWWGRAASFFQPSEDAFSYTAV